MDWTDNLYIAIVCAFLIDCSMESGDRLDQIQAEERALRAQQHIEQPAHTEHTNHRNKEH